MGSGYNFGELKGMGNDQRGSPSSSSSSSRKGKKSSSDKPKQPQRGLGVAQLEKIRLHGEFNPETHAYHYSSSFPTFNQQQEAAAAASSSFSYSTTSTSPPPSYALQYPNSMMMGIGHDHYETANIRYADSQAATTASWYPSNSMLETQHIAQPSMTRQLLNSDIEDAQGIRVRKNRSKSTGSTSHQNYEEASESEELDLELRLSL